MKQLPEDTVAIAGSMFLGDFIFIGIFVSIFMGPIKDEAQCKDEIKYNPLTVKSVYYKCEIKK